MTATGAFRDCAMSKRLYNKVCLGLAAKASKVDSRNITAFDTLSGFASAFSVVAFPSSSSGWLNKPSSFAIVSATPPVVSSSGISISRPNCRQISLSAILSSVCMHPSSRTTWYVGLPFRLTLFGSIESSWSTEETRADLPAPCDPSKRSELPWPVMTVEESSCLS